MRKMLFIAIGLSMTILSCMSEKKTMDPGKGIEVVARRMQAFEEGNMELVPYLLNFRDVEMDENYSEAFFRRMGEARLFFPDHVVPSGRVGSVVTREMPVLEWIAEDARVDSFLLKLADDPFLFLFRQECARSMLARTNLMQDHSKHAKEALWKYVEIMDEEGMYSPGLVWYALRNLNGYKSNAELASLAERMAERHPIFSEQYNMLIKQANQHPSDLHIIMGADLNEASRQNGEYLKRLKNEYHN